MSDARREFWITFGYGGRPHLEEPNGEHYNKRQYDDQVYTKEELEIYKPDHIDAHVIEIGKGLIPIEDVEKLKADYQKTIDAIRLTVENQSETIARMDYALVEAGINFDFSMTLAEFKAKHGEGK